MFLFIFIELTFFFHWLDYFLYIGLAKTLFSFFHKITRQLNKHWVVFNFIQNNFVGLYCDSCHTSVHLKKNTNIGEFLCSHFNTEMEENMQHFPCIMLYYFKRGKNATEGQKKYFCRVWRRCCDWSNMSKVVCKVSWYCCHFNQLILCCGAVIRTGGCLAAPLASAQ